jgi:MFS family permease
MTTPGRFHSGTGRLAVVVAFVTLAVAFGAVYNYGSLVGEMRLSLGLDASAAGWVFSVSAFAFLSSGSITGGLSDRYGPRPLLAAGALLVAGGLIFTSVAGDAADAVIGYITVGVGIGCVYVPSVANVGRWFDQHRAQAIGFAVTGIGVGTVLGPIITAALVEQFGWRRTDRVIAVAVFVVLLGCALLVPRSPREGAVVDSWPIRRLARDRVFRVLYVSGFLSGLALYVPIVFLAPMAQHFGISPGRAAVLVSAIGVASTGSRVLFGLMAERIGVLFAYKAAVLTMWLGFLAWLPSRSFGGLLVVAVTFGSGYGGTIALIPALLGAYFGVKSMGTASGTMQTSASIGSLLGPPLAGLLLGSTERYGLTVAVALAVVTAGTLGPLLLRDPGRTHPQTP